MQMSVEFTKIDVFLDLCYSINFVHDLPCEDTLISGTREVSHLPFSCILDEWRGDPTQHTERSNR